MIPDHSSWPEHEPLFLLWNNLPTNQTDTWHVLFLMCETNHVYAILLCLLWVDLPPPPGTGWAGRRGSELLDRREEQDKTGQGRHLAWDWAFGTVGQTTLPALVTPVSPPSSCLAAVPCCSCPFNFSHLFSLYVCCQTLCPYIRLCIFSFPSPPACFLCCMCLPFALDYMYGCYYLYALCTTIKTFLLSCLSFIHTLPSVLCCCCLVPCAL